MMKKISIALVAMLCVTASWAQAFLQKTPAATRWADSVMATLTPEQKVAQLMVVRAHSNLGADHVKEITRLIQQYNIGGLCFFQGGPVRQANLTNYYQQIAATPIMICIDGEWGLGMRLDSVINYPRQLMMGASSDPKVIYAFGKAVGEQCKRLGIHVNYAPDIDINNNPQNPVINDRSFGEDKFKVATLGIQYMKGMQDVGVMACAKHFPGHGDVAVDSHYDLPIINKSMDELKTLELYPFEQLFKAGVGSVMVGHLYVPSIDTTANRASSLSRNSVTNLLRNQMGYQGLIFTDALEMQGVKKFFPDGEASVQSLIAGNDMLCLPGDIDNSIKKVLQAVADGKLSQQELDEKVYKVLISKFHLGLSKRPEPIKLENLTNDLNASTLSIRAQLSKDAITLVRLKQQAMLPLSNQKPVTVVALGTNKPTHFTELVAANYNATIHYVALNDSTSADSLLQVINTKQPTIVAMHGYSRRPANNYGLGKSVTTLLSQLQDKKQAIFFAFGNPYALANICEANNIVACYEDDTLTNAVAYDVLVGKYLPQGSLPVTVCSSLPFGTKVVLKEKLLPVVSPRKAGIKKKLRRKIATIVNQAIEAKATPGAVVLVARNGKVAYWEAFGSTDTTGLTPVTPEMVYDLASVTKTTATTLAIMKLYETGRLQLEKTLADYLPWVRNSNKANLTLESILLHQAGMVAWIPFYRETIDTITGDPKPSIYASVPNESYNTQVAANLYMRNDWVDTMYQRILASKVVTPNQKYVYSDNDFIFLGKIVEALTGKSLDTYVHETFYKPLGLTLTTFNPSQYMPLATIVPTEAEVQFRKQTIHGFVHDPGAAMFGGVAGHAGLFSNAYELATIYQMLLNGGSINGIQLLQPSTIQKFTAYGSTISRRGLGFDKPEKNNSERKEPYPAKYVSSSTYGHTGFTGTCVWVDPEQQLVYVFLSNRVHQPKNGDPNALLKMNVRSNIHNVIYESLKN
ncbi:MAG: glycoside hydrolase family 3 N-terminal domain-containing protein [Chitinophagaceae bacterium]